MAYQRHSYGSVVLADGGTITHSLGAVPKIVNVTPTTPGTIATVTATATTLTVALKTFALNTSPLSLSLAPAASQQVWWEAAL